MSIEHPEKIGLGTWDRDSLGSALNDLESVGVAWYYTWSDWALYDADPAPGTVEFVGMTWDERLVTPEALERIRASGATALLGFNEPDLDRQADMSVAQALDLWAALAATGLRLGSPAASLDQTLGEGSWLGRFVAGAEARGQTVDFIAVHYYSDSGDVAEFEAWLKAVHDQYDKPVWVTEWVLADWTGARSFSAADQAAFARAATEMMDDLDFVERHAWFAACEGGDGWYLNSGLFDAAGNLTEVGRTFAQLTAPGAPPPIAGGAGDDRLTGTAGAELVLGGAGDDLLSGGGGADTLRGEAGNDTLQGGTGGDRLEGGTGNDLYVVLSAASTLIERPGEGWDRVSASLNWVLGDHVEQLTLTGGAALDGTGNALGNVLTGTGAANRLDGREGDDTLQGGAGEDWLLGGAGHDRLWGGAGADLLEGGAGDDIYAVDTPGDRTFERPGEGWDRVCASVSWTLGDHVEQLTLGGGAALDGTGNALANVLTGNGAANLLDGRGGHDTLQGAGGNDTLQGGAGGDWLLGGAGHDRLWGGAGADLLEGGAGDDIYAVDTPGDRTFERPGEGWDRVCASVSWTLGDHVEQLTLGGSAALDGTGNALANVLIGNAGASYLCGLGGRDTLSGGAGDDGLVGGAGDDRLWGGAGNDWLDGGEGADLLDGGAGSDLLIGGAGADLFIFTGGWDRIADFEDDLDTLRLDHALWGGTPPDLAGVPGLASVTGAGLMFDFGAGNGIVVEGISSVWALIDDLQIV
ncbi:glycosyl hydrolase [Rhodovulum sp. BSW8]|uniref:glycosyl hydrolase n=1 Tax=Rhodovulum sp. BSW8 TaxID=2259645 RepID=UPI00140309B3|nr:glycosyl hydrolase [Rhodovulum sp. BSW8]